MLVVKNPYNSNLFITLDSIQKLDFVKILHLLRNNEVTCRQYSPYLGSIRFINYRLNTLLILYIIIIIHIHLFL